MFLHTGILYAIGCDFNKINFMIRRIIKQSFYAKLNLTYLHESISDLTGEASVERMKRRIGCMEAPN